MVLKLVMVMGILTIMVVVMLKVNMMIGGGEDLGGSYECQIINLHR